MEQVLDAIAQTADLVSRRGWAERNAGNISVDVTEVYQAKALLSVGRETCGEVRYPELAGRSYLVTATGARFRDIATDPSRYVVLVSIPNDLSGYYTVPLVSGEVGILTTSEFPSHLCIHAYLRREHPDMRAVLHTHPDHLLALTHVRQYLSSETLTRLLWSMHPEMKIVMPDGVGVVPYRLPGSEALAQATVEVLRLHRLVLWEKHGCVAVGRDVFAAFDLIDTAEKSAKVYLLAKSAGFEPEGLTDKQLAELSPLSLL